MFRCDDCGDEFHEDDADHGACPACGSEELTELGDDEEEFVEYALAA